jgi:hypothetical protein
MLPSHYLHATATATAHWLELAATLLVLYQCYTHRLATISSASHVCMLALPHTAAPAHISNTAQLHTATAAAAPARLVAVALWLEGPQLRHVDVVSLLCAELSELNAQ